MSCQFGIYADREVPLDQSEVLIYQLDHGSPRATLNVIAPFLRTFHEEQGMDDTGLLGAALTWYLIDLHLDSMPGLILPKVEIVKDKTVCSHGIVGWRLRRFLEAKNEMRTRENSFERHSYTGLKVSLTRSSFVECHKPIEVIGGQWTAVGFGR